MKIEVESDTWRFWRNTSIPKVTMMTAATFIPPAAVWIAWKTRSMQILKRDMNQGCHLSMIRPPMGPNDTPAIPINPKSPITSLIQDVIWVNCYCYDELGENWIFWERTWNNDRVDHLIRRSRLPKSSRNRRLSINWWCNFESTQVPWLQTWP